MTLPLTHSTNQCVLHWLRRTPNAVAVIERRAAYTYGDLGVCIVQYVKALRATALQPGVLVGVAVENRYLHLILLLACEILGVTTLSLSPADVAAGDPILARCDLLCLDNPQAAPAEPAGILTLTQDVIDRIGRLPVADADFALLDHAPADDAVLTLVRTSGSTGRPKIMAMTGEKTRTLTAGSLCYPNDPGSAWNFLNLYGFSLRSAYRETAIALRYGCTVVSSQLWSLLDDMTRFAQFRTTLVSGDAVRLAATIPDTWAGPRDGVMTVKGGALAPVVRQALSTRLVRHLFHSYAANETHRMALIGADGVGTLYPEVALRIVDADGRVLPIGETGLIEARTPMMVDGYLLDEAATRDAFRDGWYRTNDLGRMPDPGHLLLSGRADDMVSIGGIKFAPHGLEQRIRDTERAQEAVLLALTDADGTEALHVVLEAPDQAGDPALQERLTAMLAGYADRIVPHVLSALPRTDTGKIRRTALKAMLHPS